MEIAAGTRIGRYEVLAPLGAGGMGRIYFARDTRLARRVALKLLPPEIAADSQLLTRFRREAQAVLALNHPHVVTVYDMGEVDGIPFLATELVEGANLRQRMADGEVSVGEALSIGTQVASALGAAHAAGIVHRDVKPENVMLRHDGYVKVLDFGIAKVLEGSPARVAEDLRVTQEDTLVGTVGYMSPEQLQGISVDGRSDIWSLGVVLFELLTGRLPFTARNASGVIAAILTAPIPAPSQLAEHPLPRALDVLLARMLARDLGRRYPSCDELFSDLERLRVTLESRAGEGRDTEVMVGRASSTGPWLEIAAALQSPGDEPPRHNLPHQTTSFHGREEQLAAVLATLRRPDTRLVVLTGPGGAGKTRLALEAASALVNDFAEGVWLVPLAAVCEPDAVPAAIADVLGVKELGDRPSLQRLREWLRPRHLLLLLDNLEQVVSAGPTLANLLAGAPSLQMLVTSRQVLHLRGEHTVKVPPLPLPAAASPLALGELAASPAVSLFVARAQALDPTFVLDAANAASVAELCRRLDGLPLAIELAAARVRLLSPQAMLRRLDDRFRLLAAGAVDLPDRHRTLRGTLDWGYELLREPERRLFRRLAVFRSSVSLPAALAVCFDAPTDELEALELLGSLLDQSLLQRHERVGREQLAAAEEPRFAMLETVREYAGERLGPDERGLLLRRHAAYFLDLAERGVPELAPATPDVPLSELAAAEDDLRAALEWALAQPDPEPALRLTGSLWWFWYLQGQYRQGRGWADAALALHGAERSPARARTLLGAGMLAFLMCDYPGAQRLLAASGELARELGERRVLAATLQFSGSLARERGDYDRALALHGESLALWRELGDERGVARSCNYLAFVSWLRGDLAGAERHATEADGRFRALDDREGLAWALLNLGAASYYRGALVPARDVLRQALALASDAGYKEGIAWALNLLGDVALREGRSEQAEALLRRSLELHRDLGDRWRMASVLEALAAVSRARGELARAARLDAGAAALRQTLGTPLPPAERQDWEAERAAAGTALGDLEAALTAEARALTPERLVAYALEGDGADPLARAETAAPSESTVTGNS